MTKMHKKTIIITAVICIVGIVACILIARLRAFHYEDHLDEPVVTVDDSSITLREFGYYIYDAESMVQQQALIYDPDNPNLWWNTHFSAGADSAFVCDMAKKSAINTYVCMEIFYNEAVASGMSLTDAEENTAANEARQMYESMDEHQLDATGLTEDIILEIKRKQALATKYVMNYIKTNDFRGYNEDPLTLMSWDGDYYKAKILPEHAVGQNDKILDNITFGKITVNYTDP